MTLRRDLKPGTVFSYVYQDYKSAYCGHVDTHDQRFPYKPGSNFIAKDGREVYYCTSASDPGFGDQITEVEVHWTPPEEPQVLTADPNPKQRFGDLKAAVQLVPPALVLGAAKALKEGAIKYGAYNWRSAKVEMMTYIGGAMRHLAAILDGEDVDPESSTGKLHLEGLAANAAILLDAWYGKFLIDNRPPAGPAPAMVRTPVEVK